MNSIVLDEYVRYGMLLKNIAENQLYDAVIYESLADSKIELPDNLQVHTLDSTNIHTIVAKIAAYHQQYDKLLIVIDSIPLSSLGSLLQHLTPGKIVTCVNLLSGNSIHGKGVQEDNDIMLGLTYGLQVSEPYDFVSFFKLLEYPQSHIIRIPANAYSGNIFQDTDISTDTGIVDCTSFGLAGNHATFLFPGSHLSECIESYSLLETNNQFDGFLVVDYDFSMTDAFIASLEKTKKLVCLLDQHQYSLYSSLLQAKLYTAGMSDIEILHVFNYSEHEGFEAKKIVESIQKIER